MNTDRLHQVFANYIDKFELINNEEHNESYKWHIANQFHDLIDPSSPNFAENIKQAWKLSANLIDSSSRYCFSALVSCAEKEPESVRLLFEALFAEDGGDLVIRQRKIDTFIEDANALTGRLHSTNGMFMNDQRSAMAYLFLNDPDHHYLYKASEANNFASCIEFYEDWGSGTNFRLSVYYRMCDALVEEIRNFKELISTNETRFYDKNGKRIEGMHPDKNYHILAFDIIYGAPEFRYNFYQGIPFSTINAQARKLHEERVHKAQELYVVWEKAKAEADLYKEAMAYFTDCISMGLKVKNVINGEGTVTEINGTNFTVNFPAKDKNVVYTIPKAFSNGYLKTDIPDMGERIAKYREVLSEFKSVEAALDNATKDLDPYREYLD